MHACNSPATLQLACFSPATRLLLGEFSVKTEVMCAKLTSLQLIHHLVVGNFAGIHYMPTKELVLSVLSVLSVLIRAIRANPC